MAVKPTSGKLFRLFAISARMDLAWLLRDTKFAVAAVLSDVLSNLSVVSSLYLIALRFGGIGGMSVDEILFMMAYSTITTGLFILFGSGNNIHISRIIGRGQLEHLFMQPNSLAVQLLTSGFAPFTGSCNLLIGCAMLAVAVNRLRLPVTPGWLALLALLVAATLLTIVARAYLVSSVAFYAPVAAEEIATTAIEGTWQLSTFPLSGMPAFLQISLVTVLPEGLFAWFPSLCLLGKPPLQLSFYYPLVYAVLLSLAAQFVFRKGLRYYVQKGSNRYVPYGFRR
jgi:ABC-2 type transport system permease protein